MPGSWPRNISEHLAEPAGQAAAIRHLAQPHQALDTTESTPGAKSLNACFDTRILPAQGAFREPRDLSNLRAILANRSVA